MFGKNPIASVVRAGGGRTLHVVKGSPFRTIQGEGPYAGHPAVFVRLHGCNLRCVFCDTNFSDPDDPIYDLGELVDAIDDVAGLIKLVVITGGEPLRQPIVLLCKALVMAGFKIQIETAGTLWQEGLEQVAELVVSPKTASIHPQVYAHAIAFKYIIDEQQEFFEYRPITATQPGTKPRMLAAARPDAPVYLSPMDVGIGDPIRNARNRRLVAKLAIMHKVIAGCQLHKVLGIQEPQ